MGANPNNGMSGHAHQMMAKMALGQRLELTFGVDPWAVVRRNEAQTPSCGGHENRQNYNSQWRMVLRAHYNLGSPIHPCVSEHLGVASQ
jgi:hypothetical protein